MFDRYAKAIVGAVLAALGSWQVAVADNGVTAQEWITVAIVFLATLAGVWVVKNTPTDEDLKLYVARRQMDRGEL